MDRSSAKVDDRNHSFAALPSRSDANSLKQRFKSRCALFKSGIVWISGTPTATHSTVARRILLKGNASARCQIHRRQRIDDKR